MASHVRTTRHLQVILNVYDLVEENYYAHSFGLGAYHTGVELMGVGASVLFLPQRANLPTMPSSTWVDRLIG